MSEDWKTRLAEGPLSAVRALESCTAGELTLLTENYAFRGALAAACKELTGRAYAGKDRTALAEMHELLALIYDRDFSGVVIGEVDHERAPLLRDVAAILEAAMLGEETARIDEETVTGYPRSGTEYVRWLKNLVNDHPAGRHRSTTSTSSSGAPGRTCGCCSPRRPASTRASTTSSPRCRWAAPVARRWR